MNLRDYIPALRYGAKILPSDIVNGSVITQGNVYWVKKSTDSDYGTFITDHQVQYSDAKWAVYNTIQTAVDAAVDGRGDVIFVCPGKWVEDVIILDKQGLRLIGLGFGTGASESAGARIRCNDATTKYGFTSKIGRVATGAGFHVLSRGVEVTGFYFDGGGGSCGIYLGGGLNGGVTALINADGDPVDDETVSGSWIHRNFIRGGNEGTIGLYMNGSKFGCVIEDNIFERWKGAAIEMDAGNASCECCVIRNNTFIAANGYYGIDIYGEGNSALGCQINSNYFGDRLSHAFTMAVNNRAGSSGVLCSMDNHFACANAQVLVSTDFTSGNSAQHAGSATTGSNLYMEESAAGV